MIILRYYNYSYARDNIDRLILLVILNQDALRPFCRKIRFCMLIEYFCLLITIIKKKKKHHAILLAQIHFVRFLKSPSTKKLMWMEIFVIVLSLDSAIWKTSND